MASKRNSVGIVIIGLLVGISWAGCSRQEPAGGTPAPAGTSQPGDSTGASGSDTVPGSDSQADPDAEIGGSTGSEDSDSEVADEVGQLLLQLVGEDPTARSRAQQVLDDQELGNEVFLALMKDGSPLVRQGATYYLTGRFVAQDVDLQEAFLAGLADKNSKVRGLALQIVTRMPVETIRPAIPRLVAMLQVAEEETQNRAAVARFLGRLKIEWRLVLPALVESVKQDPADTVRKASLYGVSRIALPEEAVPIYRHVLLHDKNLTVRRAAVVQLGRLRQDAVGACAELGATLASPDDQLSDAAAAALTRIGAPAVPELMRQVSSPVHRARYLAIYSLGSIGSPAKPAIAKLKECLEDDDARVRQLAEQALRRLLFVP
jgi:HEAT repeat protein